MKISEIEGIIDSVHVHVIKVLWNTLMNQMTKELYGDQDEDNYCS